MNISNLTFIPPTATIAAVIVSTHASVDHTNGIIQVSIGFLMPGNDACMLTLSITANGKPGTVTFDSGQPTENAIDYPLTETGLNNLFDKHPGINAVFNQLQATTVALMHADCD